jgi:tyrosine-protein kinase Etk/Wzc
MNSYPIERRAANRLPPPPPPDDAFGIRGALDTVLQHGRLALTVFALTFAAALLYLLLAAPVFRADTVLEIDTRTRSSLLPTLSGNDRGGAGLDPQQVSGEMELLRAREVLMPVIEATGADISVRGARRYGYLPVGSRHGIDLVNFELPQSQRGNDFDLSVAEGRWELHDEAGQSLAKGALGERAQFAIDAEPASILVKADKDLPKTRVTLRREVPLKAYEDVLTRLRMFEPSRDSNVVRLSIEDTRPERAAALLNALVANYVSHAVRRRAVESEKALAYLEDQLPALKERVNSAEDQLREQQSKSSAAPFNTEAEALLRQRTDLERQQVELRVKRSDLAQKFTAQHPDLIAVNAQLGTVQRALNALQDTVKRFPAQQRDLMPLQREVQTSTQLYTAMLTHVQQLRVQTASGLPSARQIDAAATPFEPVRPRAAAVLSIGAGMGLILALSCVLAWRALQPTVSDSREFESHGSAPTLAVIPESDAQLRLMDSGLKDRAVEELGTHRLLVRAAPADPAVESLRSLYLSLMMRPRTEACKVVMITSPAAGSGKAFVASNLAALMSETGKRVLLIESDLRTPGVHKFVGLDEHAPGLSDIVVGRRGLKEVIRSHVAMDLDVILQGTATDNPGALLLSQVLDDAMIELRQRYDHIIVNTAPMLPSGDAVAVGRVVDVALLVVRAEHSLLTETRDAQRRLERAGIKLEGILVNGVKRNRLNAPRLS